jgi:hypothetical protein
MGYNVDGVLNKFVAYSTRKTKKMQKLKFWGMIWNCDHFSKWNIKSTTHLHTFLIHIIQIICKNVMYWGKYKQFFCNKLAKMSFKNLFALKSYFGAQNGSIQVLWLKNEQKKYHCFTPGKVLLWGAFRIFDLPQPTGLRKAPIAGLSPTAYASSSH